MEYTDFFKKIQELTEKQISFSKDTFEWNYLEKEIIEQECKLFNELVRNETEKTIDQHSTVLALLSIHLIKYFNNNEFETELKILSEESMAMIFLIINHLNGKIEDNNDRHK